MQKINQTALSRASESTILHLQKRATLPWWAVVLLLVTAAAVGVGMTLMFLVGFLFVVFFVDFSDTKSELGLPVEIPVHKEDEPQDRTNMSTTSIQSPEGT